MKIAKDKGITLVVLVITIIILLILAGITITQLTGSGLFEKVKEAKEKSEVAQNLENSILSDYENEIEKYIEGTRNDNTDIYSTEEIKIGTWINGKPLYRKVINVYAGNLTAKTDYKYGIENAEFIRTTDFWYTRTSEYSIGTITSGSYYSSSEYVSIFSHGVGIYFDDCSSIYTLSNLWAIVEYTKTTD